MTDLRNWPGRLWRVLATAIAFTTFGVGGLLLVDGRPVARLGHEHRAGVGGDAKCYAIACASIVAKVARDRLMTRLARRYPSYAWDRNAGYGTAEHMQVLDNKGLTVHHRRSFCRTHPL